ncbi:hypothetical protein GHK68_24365 [Sinorhizobium meliloti]|uniref:hypothetical protein n=1 Tax=Rhizobium meliloti TaxID=382 RepID=UPI00129681F1|nr:hypothetical protein [Sinorhizobium meliloti]MQW45308.1 hypothetical protein [Sinorhizobium meliloti]
MTLILYIVKDGNGVPVAGPYVAKSYAEWRAKCIAAPQPCTVEPHTLATTTGEGG